MAAVNLELKDYQKAALDRFASYLRDSVNDGCDMAFYRATRLPYRKAPEIADGTPYMCLRVPTGGGKTLMAAHAVGIAAQDYLQAANPMVLWLVPSNPILEQTVAALKNLEHPYRAALAKDFGRNVTILTKAEALAMSRADATGGACIIVATVQSFRRERPDGEELAEGLKVYQDAGALMDHFSGLTEEQIARLDKVEGTHRPVASLANLLRLHRPMVIVDEAHNRQAERFAREGVPLSLSTLADQVGAAAHALMPLYKLIEAHVLAATRIHGDDTTVPVMAKGKTDTARLWVYVRDDRPFAGADPPAALFHYSRDRRGEHPQAHLAAWSGILQADAYGGYGELYREGRAPGPVLEAGCFAHARRKFFELADVVSSARKKSRGQRAAMIYPIALEAVQRLDALFDIERGINGKSPAERVATRQELSAPLMAELHTWLTDQVTKLSRGHDLTKACFYMLKRWDAFTRFLDDGRICLTNNAAERALRCIPLGRKAWLFCGSDHGGQRAAIIYTLIQTAKLNNVDPQAWLADVLARIADHPATKLDQLLPWNWAPSSDAIAA